MRRQVPDGAEILRRMWEADEVGAMKNTLASAVAGRVRSLILSRDRTRALVSKEAVSGDSAAPHRRRRQCDVILARSLRNSPQRHRDTPRLCRKLSAISR